MRKPGNAGGAKGHHFRHADRRNRGQVIDVSLGTPFKIRRFQRKLYTKAKQEPSYRFYALYDKICREDILEHAYELAKANGGAPGVDNQSFEAIEAAGRGTWLADARKQLIEQTYRPEPVRRVHGDKIDALRRSVPVGLRRDRCGYQIVALQPKPTVSSTFGLSCRLKLLRLLFG